MKNLDECEEITDGAWDCGDNIYIDENVHSEVPSEVDEYISSEESKEELDIGLIGDISKAAYIITTPMITKSEAGWMEENFAAIFLGSIATGLSTAMGFYIYMLIGEGLFSIVSDPFLNAIISLAIIILCIAFLNFLQFRVLKALKETKILERFGADEIEGGIAMDYDYKIID